MFSRWIIKHLAIIEDYLVGLNHALHLFSLTYTHVLVAESNTQQLRCTQSTTGGRLSWPFPRQLILRRKLCAFRKSCHP